MRFADIGVQIRAVAGGAGVRHDITTVQIGIRRAVRYNVCGDAAQRQDAIGVGRTVPGHGGRGESGRARFAGKHLRLEQRDLVRNNYHIAFSGAAGGGTRISRCDRDIARAILKSVFRRYRLSLGRIAGAGIGGRRDRGGIGRILHAALMHVPIGSLGREAHRSDEDRHGKSDKHNHNASPVAGKSPQPR